MTADHPIRVVLFCNRHLEPAARRFLVRLAEHPEIELVGAFAQGGEASKRERFREVLRRRGVLGLPVFALGLLRSALQRMLRSAQTRDWERRAAPLVARIEVVPDLHAPAMLQRISALQPDLGLIYGAPILKPSLFEIPRLGTLGIHHGRLPAYRGRKTTFWQVFNGEREIGVTIQQVDAGADTGRVVLMDGIPAGRKPFRRIVRETQALGVDLYIDAILQIRRGLARPWTPPGRRGRHYRDPTLWQILQLPFRRLFRRQRR